MTQSLFAKIPFVGKFVDERFFEYRRRSTSLAGIFGAWVAVGIFEYRCFHDHFLSWDLLAVLIVMVTVKMAMMVWYRLND
jgi:hypothetical protein